MTEQELNQMHDWEDKCNELTPKRDEWECADLQCSHYDGDDCTLGGCFDPPANAEGVCLESKLDCMCSLKHYDEPEGYEREWVAWGGNL